MKSNGHVRGIGLAIFALGIIIGRAEAQQIRDSAFAAPKHSWSVGIFNPLAYQFATDWGLETHPLVALSIAPHFTITQGLASSADWALQGRYGMSLPTWSLKFGPPLGFKGYLSPQCMVYSAEPGRGDQCDDPGWVIAPALGLRFSHGREWILTFDVGITTGFLLSGDRPSPLDTYAPVNIVYAPATHGVRADLGLRLSRMFNSWISSAFEIDIHRLRRVGPLEPWLLSLYLGIDIHLTQNLLMTAGSIYFNHDQGAFQFVDIGDGYVRKESVRSHDIYPTFDIIWTY